jgi:hypothetical protein
MMTCIVWTVQAVYMKAPRMMSVYTLKMQYSPTGRILRKDQVTQKKASNNNNWIADAPTTYDLVYKYDDDNHPHAFTNVDNRTYSYDANGNQSGWDHDKNGTRRHIIWDEENRIMAISDNGRAQHYIYDASGQRVIKAHGDGTSVTLNGVSMARSGRTGNVTVFVSPYLVVQGPKYTKHFYIESQRIATKQGAPGTGHDLGSSLAGGDSINWSAKKQINHTALLALMDSLGEKNSPFVEEQRHKVPTGIIKATGRCCIKQS